MGNVPVEALKPHPKQAELFSDLGPEKREELKRSIAAHGIRDPIKILPDYTIIAGHQRWQVARELGLKTVPVEILDLPPEEAEYLLVADNTERRGEERDPIKKAKQAELLARYWGVREGSCGKRIQKLENLEGKICPQTIRKTLGDVAEAIGENLRTTKNLLSLNSLIPELQAMVSAGTLKQSAAYELAVLARATQKALLENLGAERLAGLAVAEVRRIKDGLTASSEAVKRVEAEMERLKKRLSSGGCRDAAVLRERLSALERENRDLCARQPEIVERVVEEYFDAEGRKALEELEAKKRGLVKELSGESGWLEKEVKTLKAEEAVLDWDLSRSRETVTFMRFARELFLPLKKNQDEFLRLMRQVRPGDANVIEIMDWLHLLSLYQDHLKECLASREVERRRPRKEKGCKVE